MKNEEFYTSQDTVKKLNITNQTLRRWVKEGKIHDMQLPSKRYLYYKSEVERIINGNNPINKKQQICYA